MLKDMKIIFLFAIVSSLIFLLTIHQVSADLLTPKTISELYKEYKLIIRGHVISVSQNLQKNLTSYDVKIDEFLKLSQQYSVITVFSSIAQNPNTNNVLQPKFSVGDNVQFYLDQGPEGYSVSPYSFKMDDGCTGFTGLTFLNYSAPIPASDEPRFFDLNSSRIDMPSLDQSFQIKYDGVNDTPLNKTLVELLIRVNNDTAPIFHDKKLLSMQPCSGLINASWYFAPHQVGNYNVEVTQTSGLYNNKIIFGNYSSIATFSITRNTGEITMLSPLKQFKSGVVAKDVKCANNLQLIIKAKDGSPACVKPETTKILYERGWTKPVL